MRIRCDECNKTFNKSKGDMSDLSTIFAAENVIIDIEEGILEYMVKR